MNTATTRYSHLNPGDRFRFVYGWPINPKLGDIVHERLSGQWYRCGQTGRRFKTGAAVTVQKVDQ